MATLASQIFAALVRRRNRGYDNGTLGVSCLGVPVVSVGNLSVGGSAKTPTVIALAEQLRGRGLPVDVLTRGYRRQARELAVAEHGDEDVSIVGDEPLLIARRARVPVIVFPDRYRAGLHGEYRFHPRLHLLDDGFQHRQLARRFDLVLVDPRDLDGRLLPAGRLREPPSALGRASAVLWLADSGDVAGELERARARLASWTPAPVFVAWRRPRPLAEGTPRRLFGFCALARPESFRATLAGLGIELAGWRAFRDHHAYSEREFQRLRAAAAGSGAQGLVTTEKDAVKLEAFRPGGELHVVSIDLCIEGMAELVRMIIESCGGPAPAP